MSTDILSQEEARRDEHAPDGASAATPLPTAENLGLFIVWSTGAPYLDRIIEDLRSTFELLRIDSVHWSPELVMENYRRFYCDIPVRGVYHQLNKGKEPFTAILLWDPEPEFAARATARGLRYVNARLTDSKNRYRQWTGGVGVHCAETPWETARDLTMLFGPQDYAQLCAAPRRPAPERRTLPRDIMGARGWHTAEELFQTLNRSVNYVCIEDTLSPPHATQGPIPQLLTDHYVSLHAVVNPSMPLYRPEFGGTFTLNVAGEPWLVGLRFAGDGYFDASWAMHMLEHRVADAHGIFRPPEPDRLYSALFEACVRRRQHPVSRTPLPAKLVQSTERRTGFSESSTETLRLFLQTSDYECPRPKDPTAAHEMNDGRLRAVWRRLGSAVSRATKFLVARAVHRYLLARDATIARARWLRTAKRYLAGFGRIVRKHFLAWVNRGGLPDENLFADDLRLLGVGPAPTLAASLSAPQSFNSVSVHTDAGILHLSVAGDSEPLPFLDRSSDAVLYGHGTAHIDGDTESLAEILRVAEGNGWSLIGMPVRLDEATPKDFALTGQLADTGFEISQHRPGDDSEQRTR
jgi:hypothetical protein